MVGNGQFVDVVFGKYPQVTCETCLLLGERGEVSQRVGCHGLSFIDVFVTKGGNIAPVFETGFAHEILRNLGSSRGGEERAYVNRHVEKAERGVALVGILRVVI